MPSVDREGSRDRELVLKHQSSMSDSGRSSVPMWDSSDPDRAPPPLPLNPATAGSPLTKANASATVAAAAEAFAAKARESIYTINPMPIKSPEKSLMKGQYHKRMQSIQNTNGTIRDLSGYLENTRSPDRSPERLQRSSLDFENRSPTRSGTPTPLPRDIGKEMPSLRPTRQPPKAILGETTPQSATMLALQNTPTPKDVDNSLSNITNGSTALVRTPQSIDAISTQISSLTNIANNLQREMAQLSRRSKDNATDLISLKEATNARDEDIRKSLRDLVSNLQSQALTDHANRLTGQTVRAPGSYLLEEKPYISPISMTKSISLPRIPSPSNFSASLDREFAGSPAPYPSDGAASIALLEKILREMATKEGQERLIVSLSEMQNKPSAITADPNINKKLEDVLTILKENSGSRALVTRRDNGNGSGDKPPQLELDFDNPMPLPLARSARNITPHGFPTNDTVGSNRNLQPTPKAVDFVSEDMMKLLKRLKDSVTEGGGMSAEIKALVRELRGEVLGMGREIGRKLDQAELAHKQLGSKIDSRGPEKEEIVKIVEDGLAKLREHMDRVMQERRRQSSASTISRSTVDSQEVYMAVKNALREMPVQQQVEQRGTGIEREEILDAVREAWETYKPEIELQNFGLERDEILECLKEGLEQYKPQENLKETSGATYEEVLEAVQEGLKYFKPPPPVETEASITKDEILTTVRECLESYEFPNPNFSEKREIEITKEDVLDAVREGLSAQVPVSREIEVNRDDLFDAVKAGFESAPTPMGGVGEQVLEKMQDLIDGMKGEFKQYSAANGRDTEQVLDAMKDGLEALRAGIETYVDRASDVTGKDEIIDTVKDGLENLRIDLEGAIANGPHASGNSNNGELLDAMEKEFEHLRQTIATSMLRDADSSTDKDEILDTIREGLDQLKTSMLKGPSDQDSENLAAMKAEFEHLRETLATSLVRSGPSIDKDEIIDAVKECLEGVRLETERGSGRAESVLSNTSELLDAFNDGLDGLKADIEKVINKPVDMTVNYEILDMLKDGLANLRADIDRLHIAQAEQESVSGRKGGEVVVADPEAQSLHRTDIENLEVMITQLRIKVESLDNMTTPPPEAPQPAEPSVPKEDFERLAAIIEDLHANFTAFSEREKNENHLASKEDTDAIETLLQNTKARLDEIEIPETEGLARTEHLDSLHTLVKSMRDNIEDIAARQEVDTASKTDVGALQTLLKEIRVVLEEMGDRIAGDSIEKSDLEAIGSICNDTKTQIEELVLPGIESLPSKEDFDIFNGLVKDFQDKVEADADLTAQAFEARKVEHGAIADKVEDVKAILDDIRQELKSKLENSDLSLATLAETLQTINTEVLASDTTESIKELTDIIKREFEVSHSKQEDAKQNVDQHQELVLGRQDEIKNAIISEMVAKLETRFDDLMIKYDDAQLAAEAQTNALNEKRGQQDEAMDATRSIAEELKSLMNTLGASVTDSYEHINEDSKTIFSRVDGLSTKLDASTAILTTTGQTDHQLTRAEVSKALLAVQSLQTQAAEHHPKVFDALSDVLNAVQSLQTQAAENHPKVFDALSDVLNTVGQQFEQSQRTTEQLKISIDTLPSSLPVPAIAAPPLPSPTIEREIPPPEKYDDSEIHAKLDKLVEHTAQVGEAVAHIDILEQIKGQVEATAAEFAAFVSSQQTVIAETQQSRAREAEEAAIALEKRTAQKKQVEADIIRLSEDSQSLAQSVEGLRQEESQLASQKAKLQAELSSLETALQIRREEMRLMEARAEGLERRIVEGVLDHSRSLLMTSRPQSSLKGMSLKRVTSTASHNSASTARASTPGTTAPSNVPSTTESAHSQGLSMALKRRQPTRSTVNNVATKKDRRILSLSTIGSNRGPTTERSLVLANPSFAGSGTSKANLAFGNGGLKRSHSVKSNFPARKTSWGGTKQGGMYADEFEEDKENSILDEEDEEGSDGGTERRTSYSTDSGRKTSYSGTYTGTGSWTGSVEGEDDRRSRYAASTVGTVGNEDEDDNHEESPETERGMVIFGVPSDSALGSDLPTAAIEGGKDYFKG